MQDSALQRGLGQSSQGLETRSLRLPQYLTLCRGSLKIRGYVLRMGHLGSDLLGLGDD